MTVEEQRILKENSHVHSLVNKLLDERLKHLMPEGKFS